MMSATHPTEAKIAAITGFPFMVTVIGPSSYSGIVADGEECTSWNTRAGARSLGACVQKSRRRHLKTDTK